MAALSPTDAVQRVLENVGRVVGDAQCPAAAIQRVLDDEYRVLRRKLSAEFPTIYEALSTTFVLTTTSTITKPTDCETIRVVEKQAGSGWYPLDVASSLNRDQQGRLSFYEFGAILQIVPEASAAGSYRIFYEPSPPTVITTYQVPDGMERILIELASVWARQRHDEDEKCARHEAKAKQIWDDCYMGLWNRYGSHGRSGLQETRD
jgi:hypothetical protein